jgi:RNA polymerase sigma factor (sigma-70 family)
MIAVLSRLLRLDNLDLAQDIVHDTLLKAMTTWSYAGMPENPSAWLYKSARNRAIDYLRREKKFRDVRDGYTRLLAENEPPQEELFAEHRILDSQLRMIFACCHPAISSSSQIALALKTLCGLSTSEIARAYLCSEETIAKRIFRAREKIRSEGIDLELPDPEELSVRLDSVLQALYLLFNEGYNSSHPDQLIREELCEEAIRLAYLLTGQPLTNLPRTNALLSLFCFQASRLRARQDKEGQIILLRYQDRSVWYQPLIDKGRYYLQQAFDQEGPPSIYHFEAAIASLHASASSFEATSWKEIHFLYQQLYKLHPSPVVAMNRAIALAYSGEPHQGLNELLQLSGLEQYQFYHSALGELYRETGNNTAALASFESARNLTVSPFEKKLMEEKMREIWKNI